MVAPTTCLAEGRCSKNLMKLEKLNVWLGNYKAMKVEGKGTIALKTSHGNVNLLHDVPYIPCMAHNL